MRVARAKAKRMAEQSVISQMWRWCRGPGVRRVRAYKVKWGKEKGATVEILGISKIEKDLENKRLRNRDFAKKRKLPVGCREHEGKDAE